MAASVVALSLTGCASPTEQSTCLDALKAKVHPFTAAKVTRTIDSSGASDVRGSFKGGTFACGLSTDPLRLEQALVYYADGITITVVPASGQSVKPSSTSVGTFKTADALEAAYIKAGGKCTEWHGPNRENDSIQSGDCAPDMLLTVFSTTKQRDARAASLNSIGKLTGATYEVGANWVADGPMTKALAAELHARIVVVKKSK